MNLKLEYPVILLLLVSLAMLLPSNVISGQSTSDFIIPDFTSDSKLSDTPGLNSPGQSSNNELTSNIIGTNQTSGFSIYKNPKYGFEIQFPSNLEVLPRDISFPMEGIPISILSIRSPADQGIHDLVTLSAQNQSRYLDTNEMKTKTTNTDCPRLCKHRQTSNGKCWNKSIKRQTHNCFWFACMEN